MTDDVLHRFSFAHAPIRGQWVRLSATVAQAFEQQHYPQPARRLLAEMLAAVSLMADGIKFHGRVALQARGHGAVTTALAECRQRDLLRGLVRWNEAAHVPGAQATAAGALGNEPALSALLGEGRMAITLTPDAGSGNAYPGNAYPGNAYPGNAYPGNAYPGNAYQGNAYQGNAYPGNAYQGVVALTDDSLACNLETYFANSEQLPTRLFFAFSGNTVTGLLLQRLPVADLATELTLDLHDDAWREIELLAETVTPAELAGLPLEPLLRRLFHEHTVTLHPGRPLTFACTCSRERAEAMLQALPKAEILELLETQGMVDVTCEVCGARYEYDKIDAHMLYEPEPRRLH